MDNACAEVKDGALYIIKNYTKIVGTMILCHQPEQGYRNAEWFTESNYNYIYVIYTLAVHPDFSRLGIGKMLLNHAERLARKEGCKGLEGINK